MKKENVWVLRPFHVFKIEEEHYVYDVLTVAAYKVTTDTFRVLKKFEPEKSDQEVRIPEAKVPARLRKMLYSALSEMRLLGNLPPAPAEKELARHCEKTRVKQLVFGISSKCNLDCVYCYEIQNGFRDSTPAMSLNTAKTSIDHFLDQAGEEKVFVGFMGGETLLQFGRLQEIVGYAREEATKKEVDLGFKITTNGTLLDSEKIEFLRANDFQVKVSLDGSAEEQDRNRPLRNGKSSYAKVVLNVGKLLPMLPDSNVQVTVTSGATDLRKVLGHHKALGFKNIDFDFAVVGGEGDYTVKEFSELKEQYLRVAKGREEDAPGGQLGSQAEFLRSVLTDRRDSLVYCGAALTVVAVGPEGALYPCAGFFGVKEHQIGHADSWIDEDARQSYLAKTLVHKKKECKSCWARMACSGGCAMNAHVKSGDVGAPGQQNCDFFRFQLEIAVDSLASEPLLQEPRDAIAAEIRDE